MTQNQYSLIHKYIKLKRLQKNGLGTKHQTTQAEALEDNQGKDQGLFMKLSNDVLNLKKKYQRLIQNHSGNFKRMEV